MKFSWQFWACGRELCLVLTTHFVQELNVGAVGGALQSLNVLGKCPIWPRKPGYFKDLLLIRIYCIRYFNEQCQSYCHKYCRTHNVSVCLYIAYIACGSASLYIKTLYFFLTVLALSAVATVTNIKVCYDAKTPQFAIFGTHVICVFYIIKDWDENFKKIP